MARRISDAHIEELTDLPSAPELFAGIRRRPYGFFLDSACDPGKLGRYSFIGCDPFLVFRSIGEEICLKYADGRTERRRSDPLEALEDILDEYSVVYDGLPAPFVGGAVGYLSYDLKDFIERLPNRTVDDLRLPEAVFGFYDSVIIYDNLNGRQFVSDLKMAKRSGPKLKDLALEYVNSAKCDIKSGKVAREICFKDLHSNMTMSEYASSVEKAKDHIAKGDIYQVNLSQRFQGKFSGDTYGLYMKLRECSPAPFAAYLDLEDAVVLSSSPERFLLKRGNYIETRPIKGTRPRAEGKERDDELKNELKASPKEMAEHVMIVDLERNDLGRICKYGSVRPTESAIVESYANVHHLVSTVAGELRGGAGPVDCIRATFPGGSITGAPKIRSMEIIEELESVKRSVYTGSIGYIGFNGDMDTSIVIRTFIVKGGNIYFQVGGGIVADSEPDKEYEETLHKAAGLLKALGAEEAVCA